MALLKKEINFFPPSLSLSLSPRLSHSLLLPGPGRVLFFICEDLGFLAQ